MERQKNVLTRANMIVNCTSVGFGKLVNKSPIKLEKKKI